MNVNMSDEKIALAFQKYQNMLAETNAEMSRLQLEDCAKVATTIATVENNTEAILCKMLCPNEENPPKTVDEYLERKRKMWESFHARLEAHTREKLGKYGLKLEDYVKPRKR